MAELKFRVMNDEGDFVDTNQKQETNAAETATETTDSNVEAEVQTEVQTDVQEQVQEQVQETIENNGELQQETESETKNETQEVVEPASQELDDSRILQHLKERYNAQFESLDDVLKNNEEKQVELPEDISKYLEYKNDTGRGLEDYMRIQKDLSSVDETTLLSEYYKETKPYLSAAEVPEYIKYNFGADEDGEDKANKQRELAYKEELYNAREYFNTMKEKYKAPLESSTEVVPEEYKKAYESYNNYIKESEETQKATQERASFFSEKTEKLFDKDFKGFEYSVGDKKVLFKPKNIEEVKNTQSNINNYIERFIDDKGFLKDPEGYHRSLNMALNPDAVFRFAYEQGVADATDGLVKETKNIDMNIRDNKESEKKGGFQYRVLNDSDSYEMKIKKR
jgi:hypothetical protein